MKRFTLKQMHEMHHKARFIMDSLIIGRYSFSYAMNRLQDLEDIYGYPVVFVSVDGGLDFYSPGIDFKEVERTACETNLLTLN
jgi:hypothetical protein